MAHVRCAFGSNANDEKGDDDIAVRSANQSSGTRSMCGAAGTVPDLPASKIRKEIEALLRQHQADMMAHLDRYLCLSESDLINTGKIVDPQMGDEGVSQVAKKEATTLCAQGPQTASSGKGTSLMQGSTPKVEDPKQSLGFKLEGGEARGIVSFADGAVADADEVSQARDDSAAAAVTATDVAPQSKTSLLKKALSSISSSEQVEIIHGSSRLPDASDSWAHLMLRSTVYELLITCVVVLNAAFLGYQVQLAALKRGNKFSETSQYVTFITECAFCVVFSLELLIRIYCERQSFFWSSREWKWNMFDSIILASMLVELVAENALASLDSSVLGQVSALRVLRVCRLMRLFRILKLLKFLRELRIMFLSILSSIKPFFWVCSILAMLSFVFSIALTTGVVDHLNETDAWEKSDSEFLVHHFGRLDSTMLSLLEAMTGGVSWGELFDATQELSPIYSAMFLLFILVTLLGLLNVVTGVFLDTALGNSKADSEMIIAAEMAAKRETVEKLASLFNEIDDERRGAIRFEQLTQALSNERVQAYLSGIGLSADDAECLFVLLDRDEQGEIDTKEFTDGCMKLLGQASGVELAKVALEGKWIVHNLVTVLELVTDLGQKSVKSALHMDDMKRQLDALSGGGLLKNPPTADAFATSATQMRDSL